jgi:cold-inducible RNA-binding protein
MENKIFVGNLPWTAEAQDLEPLFTEFGGVQEVALISDRETGRSRGFAFVTFETPEAAQAAVDALEGSDFMGRPLKVNIARPREDRGERSGGGGGGGWGGGGGGGGRGGDRRGGGGGGGRGGDRRGGGGRDRRGW